MIHIWIWYPTVLWVLYETWTMSDRGGSPHRPQDYIQLHTGNTCLLPWIQKKRVRTMYLSCGLGVQWWWYLHSYSISLLYECSNRYWPHLTLVNHPTDNCMTSNYTPHMLSCYPDLRIRAWTMYISSGVLSCISPGVTPHSSLFTPNSSQIGG